MVAIEITGCPKNIHFVREWRAAPHPRYSGQFVYHPVDVSDPDCPCRQKLREALARAENP